VLTIGNSSKRATSLEIMLTSMPVPEPELCSTFTSIWISFSWISAVVTFFQFQPSRMDIKNTTWWMNTWMIPTPLSSAAYM